MQTSDNQRSNHFVLNLQSLRRKRFAILLQSRKDFTKSITCCTCNDPCVQLKSLLISIRYDNYSTTRFIIDIADLTKEFIQMWIYQISLDGFLGRKCFPLDKFTLSQTPRSGILHASVERILDKNRNPLHTATVAKS